LTPDPSTPGPAPATTNAPTPPATASTPPATASTPPATAPDTDEGTAHERFTTLVAGMIHELTPLQLLLRQRFNAANQDILQDILQDEEMGRGQRPMEVEEGEEVQSSSRAVEIVDLTHIACSQPPALPPPAEHEVASTECCICMEPFDTGARRRSVIMPCFHATCCSTCCAVLYARGDSCPVCRSPLATHKAIHV